MNMNPKRCYKIDVGLLGLFEESDLLWIFDRRKGKVCQKSENGGLGGGQKGKSRQLWEGSVAEAVACRGFKSLTRTGKSLTEFPTPCSPQGGDGSMGYCL